MRQRPWAATVPGTVHQTSGHKIHGSASYFHFHSSWDIGLVANTHLKPAREGNSGKVKKAKLPHPQNVSPVFPNSIHGMTSSHYPDSKPRISLVPTPKQLNQFTLLLQCLFILSQPLFQSLPLTFGNRLRLWFIISCLDCCNNLQRDFSHYISSPCNAGTAIIIFLLWRYDSIDAHCLRIKPNSQAWQNAVHNLS